jgi:hypothetical protein
MVRTPRCDKDTINLGDDGAHHLPVEAKRVRLGLPDQKRFKTNADWDVGGRDVRRKS